MTAYNLITNAEIDPESPVTESLMQRLRDNPIAMAEGDPVAPRINPAAISIGGKGSDGVFNNATTITGGPGFYDFASVSRSTNITLPVYTVMRVAGNSTWSGVVTLPTLSDTLETRLQEKDKCEMLGAILGADADTTGDGGGSYGGDGLFAFNVGLGTRGRKIGAYNYWSSRRAVVGGVGDIGSSARGGGGALVLVVEGNLDLTGCSVIANGQVSAPGNKGGSGAGSIIIVATGTITGGTFTAKGGASQGAGAAGGSGVVQLVCSGFLGSQTIDVAGVSSGGTTSEAGLSSSITMSADFIRTLFQRL